MGKMIRRTLSDSIIHASKVDYKNGKVVTEDLPAFTVINTLVTDDKALKLVQNQYGKKAQYVIKDIEIIERCYEISVEDFVANAQLVVDIPTDDQLAQIEGLIDSPEKLAV